MTTPKPVECWLTDMDGVLVHEESAIPGAAEFIAALQEHGRRFLVLTNNSIFTPRDLRARLLASGLDVPEESIWTSALATAQFLADQRPGGSAFVVGEAGLTTALYEVGYTMTERDPDYVVLGETRTYSFEAITKAIRLIEAGARFIATNPDVSGPSPQGTLPATGSVAALISGGDRPPALLRRQAQPADDAQRPQPDRRALRVDGDDRRPDGHRRDQRPRGGAAHHPRADRVDAAATRCGRFPYQPTRVVDSIADVVPLVAELRPSTGPAERLTPSPTVRARHWRPRRRRRLRQRGAPSTLSSRPGKVASSSSRRSDTSRSRPRGSLRIRPPRAAPSSGGTWSTWAAPGWSPRTGPSPAGRRRGRGRSAAGPGRSARTARR